MQKNNCKRKQMYRTLMILLSASTSDSVIPVG